MPNIGAEIIFILALTILNGFFAMSEIAIVSARRARLQQRAAEGDRGAAVALELAKSPDQFLATVQIGITLAGILAGAYGGATIAAHLSRALVAVPPLAPYASAVSLIVISILIAFVQLIIGELVPKRIALSHAEPIAAFVSRPLRGLAWLTSPAVNFLGISSRGLLALLRLKSQEATPVTEDEVRMMMAEGRQAGVFEKAEQDIVERVFRMSDRRVSTIMTPRTDMVWIDIDDPIGDSMRTMCATDHTYFPVCRGSVENVLGMVSVKEQWARMVRRQPPDLSAELTPPLYVPETTPVLKLLETFKQAGRHIALVVDEFGSISGLVSLNDVLESIVGDMPSADSESDPPAVRRADGSWLLDGMLPIDKMKEHLQIDALPGENDGGFATLAGFVLSQLGHVPRVAEIFEWRGFQFEIVDMDGHRVDRVLATPPRGEHTGATESPQAEAKE
ncbi:MAG: HlyC/CorC family transporter [Phycisphaerales bacterium]|nr:HlyC/CorC family transporter [Phycisphaerales bacterium]